MSRAISDGSITGASGMTAVDPDPAVPRWQAQAARVITSPPHSRPVLTKSLAKRVIVLERCGLGGQRPGRVQQLVDDPPGAVDLARDRERESQTGTQRTPRHAVINPIARHRLLVAV